MIAINERRVSQGSQSKRVKRPSLWRRLRIWWLEYERSNHDHIIARLDYERSVAIADRGTIDDSITALKRCE